MKKILLIISFMIFATTLKAQVLTCDLYYGSKITDVKYNSETGYFNIQTSEGWSGKGYLKSGFWTNNFTSVEIKRTSDRRGVYEVFIQNVIEEEYYVFDFMDCDN